MDTRRHPSLHSQASAQDRRACTSVTMGLPPAALHMSTPPDRLCALLGTLVSATPLCWARAPRTACCPGSPADCARWPVLCSGAALTAACRAVRSSTALVGRRRGRAGPSLSAIAGGPVAIRATGPLPRPMSEVSGIVSGYEPPCSLVARPALPATASAASKVVPLFATVPARALPWWNAAPLRSGLHVGYQFSHLDV